MKIHVGALYQFRGPSWPTSSFLGDAVLPSSFVATTDSSFLNTYENLAILYCVFAVLGGSRSSLAWVLQACSVCRTFILSSQKGWYCGLWGWLLSTISRRISSALGRQSLLQDPWTSVTTTGSMRVKRCKSWIVWNILIIYGLPFML